MQYIEECLGTSLYPVHQADRGTRTGHEGTSAPCRCVDLFATTHPVKIAEKAAEFLGFRWFCG